MRLFFLLLLVASLTPSVAPPTDATVFTDLPVVKALRILDKSELKSYSPLEQYVTIDTRSGVLKPLKGISIRYSKKHKRFFVADAATVKELSVMDMSRFVGGPGDLGNGTELRCYHCGCMPVTSAGDNGPVKSCNGACPCMGWVVGNPAKTRLEYYWEDGWSDWRGLP